MQIPIGIVGFRGYGGAELVRIFQKHSQVEPVLLEHRDAEDQSRPLGQASPRHEKLSPEKVHAEGLAVVFLATPAEVSLELTLPLLEAGAKVIDLSGAFRLGTVENYQRWYKETHHHPKLLAEAAYGLPEFYRSLVPGARLVSNPGCYPTAANLAIKPLIDAGVVVREAGIVCDAKSGVSGAGRKPSLKTSFCEVTENFSVYSVLNHRHVPEILRTSALEEGELSFTAQLLPIDRGILETIYFRAKGVASAADLLAIYQKAYAGEPFVRLYAAGQAPDLRVVSRTNFCDIGVHYDAKTGRAVVISAIDNLVKGAAGQAVQNMNLLLGFPETTAFYEKSRMKLLIKIGGTLLDVAESRERLAREIAAVARREHVVVVHGGGKQMTRFLAERGIESQFVNGLRVTTAEVIDAVVKVFAGSVNAQLVTAFRAAGTRPVGLSGLSAGLVDAVQLDPALGQVGKPVSSDGRLLELLVRESYLPVIACVAGDRNGAIFNVNGDQMAVACAQGFAADQLIFLTDVAGVRDAEGRTCEQLTAEQGLQLISSGVATGGMQAKIEAAVTALQNGVGQVVIAPGAHPGVLDQLLAGSRIGTRFIPG